MPTRCAVLGKPIAHSLSPAMHRAAYAELGLDWSYEAIEVAESELAHFLRDCDGDWRGLSLTMPLKRTVIALADEVSPVAAELDVANTVRFQDGRILASNTDSPGALAALAERGVTGLHSARIFGGGATAASVAYALAGSGVTQLEFVVRDRATAVNAVAVAERAGATVAVRLINRPLIDVVDLLVSTIPAGAVRGRAHELVESAHAVFDVIYDPWPTALDQAARAAGRPFVSGLDLLAHQAALQVELMTGSRVDAAVLRAAALRARADS